jgi:hypothetical protein
VIGAESEVESDGGGDESGDFGCCAEEVEAKVMRICGYTNQRPEQRSITSSVD